jgi:hypothetical protein
LRTFVRITLLTLAVFIVCLGGLSFCVAFMSAQHAVPTAMRNQAASAVQLRRRVEGQDWSPTLELAQGGCVADGAFVADLTGVEAKEAGRTFTITGSEFVRLSRACPRAGWDPLAATGQCEITYLGSGRFRARPTDEDGPVQCNS